MNVLNVLIGRPGAEHEPRRIHDPPDVADKPHMTGVVESGAARAEIQGSTLEAERQEVLAAVLVELRARDSSLDCLAACRYLLRHLASAG
jgi:hypothetical protein